MAFPVASAHLHHHQLPQILLAVAFFTGLLLTISDSLPQPHLVREPSTCLLSSSFTCPNNGLTIRYPFWHQDAPLPSSPFSFCGYPGFNVSCAADDTYRKATASASSSATAAAAAKLTPTLRLSSRHDNNHYLFRVQKIDYSAGTVTLAYLRSEIATACPIPPRDATFPTVATVPPLPSYFRGYELQNATLLRFFYNCSLSPPSLPPIACLRHQNNAVHSFAFAADDVAEFDWSRYCESTATVPVAGKIVKGPGGVVGEINYGKALRGGFELKWQADRACGDCEESGGRCGYTYGDGGASRSFFCICSDGHRRSSHCRRPGDDATIGISIKSNIVVAGAVIFGGIVIVSTVFYFLQQKKANKYTRVSAGAHHRPHEKKQPSSIIPS